MASTMQDCDGQQQGFVSVVSACVQQWEGVLINDRLNSADSIADSTCYDIEINRSMERHQAGEARVIPILLRPVD